jgi:predicted dehydrogenase
LERAILVGSGGFGQQWAKAVQEHPGWTLAAVVDLDRSVAEQVASEYGVVGFTDLVTATAATGATVAICVVPPAAHMAVALDAFGLGMDVITEKPLADSLQSAREMIAAARASGRHLVVSQNYRWRPHIQAVKEALAEGAIGEIGYVEWHFRRATELDGWRDAYDEILLEDRSIHHMDLIRYLTGLNADVVSAASFRPPWSWMRGRPCASVQITLEGGLPVSYFGSWVDWGRQTPWDGEARIVGRDGAIVAAAVRSARSGRPTQVER